MKIKHGTRQIIAAILTGVMLFNSMPVQALADVVDGQPEPQVVLVGEPAAEGEPARGGLDAAA